MFTKEDYVSLETAKLLKEKGFDEEVNAYYGKKRGFVVDSSRRNYNDNGLCSIGYITKDIKLEFEDSFVSAPTLYKAQKWIWERHKMFVSAAPNPPFTVPLEFFFWIDFPTVTIDNFGSLIMVEHFSSYQQALDAGIRKALELIKED